MTNLLAITGYISLGSFNLSYVAIAAIAILLLSAIIGLIKGGRKTIFNILVWALTLAAAIIGAPYIYKIEFISNLFAGSDVLYYAGPVIVFGAVGLIAWLIFKFIFWLIDRRFEKSGVINRLLGMIFQLVAGAAFTLILVYTFKQVAVKLDAIAPDTLSPIINDASVDPIGKFIVETGCDWVQKLIDFIGSKLPDVGEFFQNMTAPVQ